MKSFNELENDIKDIKGRLNIVTSVSEYDNLNGLKDRIQTILDLKIVNEPDAYKRHEDNWQR